MNKILKKLIREDCGAVMVLVALGMVALIGSMALVIDAGVVYAARMNASNAVDAAVLAGVRELPGNPAAALAVAENYAQANGLDAGEVNFVLEYNDEGEAIAITGNVEKDKGMYFARIFGINSGGIDEHAKARIGLVSSLGSDAGVVPIGVRESDCIPGVTITLKHGGGDGRNGWFGGLRLGDAHGAKDFSYYLANGYDGTISIGDVIGVEPGNMSGRSKRAIEKRMDGCTHSPSCTAAIYVEGCSRIIITPVGIVDEGHGSNRTLTVTGFAAFIIEDYIGSGSQNNIEGTFIDWVVPGEIDENASNDYGLYAVELCE